MPDTIRTKAELLTLFADNSIHAITPQILRDFVVSNQVNQGQTETTPGQTIADDTDVFLAQPGATDVFLGLAADYGDRFLAIINKSGGDLTINITGGDTIDGGASIIISDSSFAILGIVVANEWLTVINTGADPDEYAQGQFSGSVAVTNIISGTFADINEALVAGEVSSQFTVGAGEITYNGSSPQRFAVGASISAGKTAGATMNYTYSLAINSVPTGPTITATLANATFGTSHLQDIVTLDTNDTIKLQVRGDITDDDIVVGDLILTLTEIQ